MNPPPTEKYVLSSIRFPNGIKASSLSPFGCRVRAPGGNIVSRSKSRSRGSSNTTLRLPASFSVFVARISATVASITAGSIVAGSFPDNPSSTARSVPCPCLSRPANHTAPLAPAAPSRVPLSLELASEPARRAHRTHRVRTRRANAKLVKIEKTRSHAEDCRPLVREP